MTDTNSVRRSATRISASVKRYDPAIGCGVLEPLDGAPELLCRKPALGADGLETPLAGATEQGLRGPEVSRILAVDLSTVSLRPQPTGGARIDQFRPAAPAASGPQSNGSCRRRAAASWRPRTALPPVLRSQRLGGADRRAPPGVPQPALRQPVSRPVRRGRAASGDGAAGHGQVLRPGPGLRLRRAGRRRPRAVRPCRRDAALRPGRPDAGPARPGPRRKRAARAPGDGHRTGLNRAGPDWTQP